MGRSLARRAAYIRTPVNATIDVALESVKGSLNLTGLWYQQYSTAQDGTVVQRCG